MQREVRGGLPARTSAFDYVERTYRVFEPSGSRWVAFRAAVDTTDLYLLAGRDLSTAALEAVRRARRCIEEHIAVTPAFATALRPLDPPQAPLDDIVRGMYQASQTAGVGPMAAVAGAVAQAVGRELRGLSPEIVVENGGDVYLDLLEDATVGLLAGNSPFGGKLGLLIHPFQTPLGVCTSSGTVGPSLSFGTADAATALAGDATLADAVATAMGNRVQSADDLQAAVEWALTVPGVRGAVAVLGDRLAAKGEVELVKIG